MCIFDGTRTSRKGASFMAPLLIQFAKRGHLRQRFIGFHLQLLNKLR
jgi:hypothetical protein